VDGTRPATTDRGLDAIGALSEPTRRALYDHVARQGGWVSRDEAADAIGIERATAAHHLDRLADDGLLDVDFQRRTGRRGPGAGRPAKLYTRARRDFEVSLPPRDYELAGALLAEAVDRCRAGGTDVVDSLREVADAAGERLAADARSKVPAARAGRRQTRRLVDAALAEEGYEPQVEADGTIHLRNCPFHRLAQSHTELICTMNLDLLRSTLSALGDTGFEAVLDPEDGSCCVKLRPTST
jgi:predicted ArsR family transcriptional regulator